MKHVFLSYLHDNLELVERLCSRLQSAGIDVWLDRDGIKPGMRWEPAIRDAIKDGAYFIACFSKEYNVRSTTYMDEELSLAMEELRQRHANRIWFIPVLLNEGGIPSRPTGAGDDVQAFQWVELYKDWNSGMERILSVIEPSAVKRPTSFVNPIDNTLMELVPAGSYRWGMAAKIEEIIVKEFYMSLYPVLNAQYRLFQGRDQGSQCQTGFVENDAASRGDKHSDDDDWAGGITLDAAKEYCEWTHTRLPTLFELEYLYFRAESNGRRLFGINCGYENMPMYWTATTGREIGKSSGTVLAPTNIRMDRRVAFPVTGQFVAPDLGVRCAASPGMVQNILRAGRDEW